jgi:hypothetical protein
VLTFKSFTWSKNSYRLTFSKVNSTAAEKETQECIWWASHDCRVTLYNFRVSLEEVIHDGRVIL